MKTNQTLPGALCTVFLAFLLVSCGGEESRQGPSAQPKAEDRAPLVQKVEVADWCKEHVVPESACTRCNASLIPDFQRRGDWCEEHSLPESQCIECHPDLKAKFDAMAPTPASE